MTLKEMKEKRAGLVAKMRALLDTAAKANRDLNTEEQANYDAMEKDVDQLGTQIDREDRLAQVENSLRGRRDHNYRHDLNGGMGSGKSARPGRALPEGYRDSLFGHYARLGRNGLLPEHVAALQAGTDSEGGYLVPEEFETRLVEGLATMDPIRAGATVIRTASERHIPVETDEGDFGYIAEEGAYGEDDPVFGRVTLGAHKVGGIVKVSEELLQDNFFDLEAYLSRLALRRYNRTEQSSFANGDGNGMPLGLFATASVAGVNITGTTGAVSATPVITTDNIIDTFHGLARAYRDNAAWITSDTLVKMLRKLKDSENQYLWQPGLQAGQPDRLLNRPVFVSDGAPVPVVASATVIGRSIMFGDLSYYYIVDRLGLTLQRLNELYAANGQVGFKFMRRHEGKLVDARAFTFFRHGAAA